MFCMSCGHQLPDEARFCFRCGSPVPVLSRSEPAIATSAPVDLTAIARRARQTLANMAIEHDRYNTKEMAHLVTYYDRAQAIARAGQDEMFTKYSGSRSRQFSYLKEIIDGLLADNLTNSRKVGLISKQDDQAARTFVKAQYPSISDPESMRSFLQILCTRWECFQVYMGIAELLIRGYEGDL